MRRSRLILLAAAAALAAPILAPHAALAWWRGGGVFIGVPFPPVVIPPPVYVPPPVYAPPPVVYAPPGDPYAQGYGAPGYPPGYGAPGYGPPGGPAYGSVSTCYAGPYTCPLAAPVPPATRCSCPGRSGPVFGQAG